MDDLGPLRCYFGQPPHSDKIRHTDRRRTVRTARLVSTERTVLSSWYHFERCGHRPMVQPKRTPPVSREQRIEGIVCRAASLPQRSFRAVLSKVGGRCRRASWASPTRSKRPESSGPTSCSASTICSLPCRSSRGSVIRYLSRVPVIAVSLTRRSEEMHLLDVNNIAGFFYLPALTEEDARRLLHAVRPAPGYSLPSTLDSSAPDRRAPQASSPQADLAARLTGDAASPADYHRAPLRVQSQCVIIRRASLRSSGGRSPRRARGVVRETRRNVAGTASIEHV